MAVSISTIIAGGGTHDISMFEAVELLRPDLVAAEIAYGLRRDCHTYFGAIRGIYSDLLVPYLPVRSRTAHAATKLKPANVPNAYSPIRGRDIILHPAPKYKLQIQTAADIADTDVKCKVSLHIGNNRFVVASVPYDCFLDVAAGTAKLSAPMSANMMKFLRSTRYLSTLSCGLRLFSRRELGNTVRHILVDLDRELAINVRIISSSQLMEYAGDY